MGVSVQPISPIKQSKRNAWNTYVRSYITYQKNEYLIYTAVES